MRAKHILAVLLTLAFAASFSACSGESSDTDAGQDGDGNTGPTPCVTDADCEEPETCQDDGYCEYQIGPKPDDNKLVGAFNCYTNQGNYGTAKVTGLFGGKYVYMEYPGCMARFLEAENPDSIQLWMDGLLTDELALRLFFLVPHDAPTDTEIKFGVGGVATGVLKHAELDPDGYVVGETNVAEVVGGYIIFSAVGAAQGNQVEGTFSVELKKIQ